MIPHEIQRGRGIEPENWNSLVRLTMANRPNSGAGYTLTPTPRGWSLSIPSRSGGGGGSTAVCPFGVSTANEGDNWKFTIAWGLIGGLLPTGMFPNNDPPLVMAWEDGWVVAKCTFAEGDVILTSVSFEVSPTSIPPNTSSDAYYPISYIDTDSSSGQPVQRINNVCSTPKPSVCDLLME